MIHTRLTLHFREYLQHQTDRLALSFGHWIRTANVFKTTIIPAALPIILAYILTWDYTYEERRAAVIAPLLFGLSALYICASGWLSQRYNLLLNPHRVTPSTPTSLAPPAPLPLSMWLPSLLLVLTITGLDLCFSLSQIFARVAQPHHLSDFSFIEYLSILTFVVEGFAALALGMVLGAHHCSSSWIRNYRTLLHKQWHVPMGVCDAMHLALITLPFFIALALGVQTDANIAWINSLSITVLIGWFFFLIHAGKSVERIRLPPQKRQRDYRGGGKRKPLLHDRGPMHTTQ